MTDLNPLVVPLLYLALGALLVVLAVTLSPRPGPDAGINRGTRFFLVMLRLAIGWHFLFEGVEKLNNPTWSSEAYLREASGPLAAPFQELAGDSLKDRLVVGADGSFPQRLGLEWDVYLDRFTTHYEMTKDQREQAKVKLDQAKDATIRFLTLGKRPVKVPGKMPPALEVELTVPERIKLYEDKVTWARQREETTRTQDPLTGWAQVRDARSQAAAIRAGLKKDLDGQTQAMMDSLATVLKPAPFLEKDDDKLLVNDSIMERIRAEWEAYLKWFVDHYQLTDQQAKRAETLMGLARERMQEFLRGNKRSIHSVKEQGLELKRSLDSVLTAEQSTIDRAPPAPVTRLPLAFRASWSRLDWADFVVTYGLLAVGALLIAGFLTRTTCLVGALFLLSFYLAMPPLPWLEQNPRAEGHYLYVNKNIIEMLALLALATTRSGRWLGIDGLLHLLRPSSWRASDPIQRPAAEFPQN
jgi:uncharacterized membrane protein YphA (DoxX/SURF4 family)